MLQGAAVFQTLAFFNLGTHLRYKNSKSMAARYKNSMAVRYKNSKIMAVADVTDPDPELGGRKKIQPHNSNFH